MERGLAAVGTGGFVLRAAPWPNPERQLLTSVVRGDSAGLGFALEGTVNGAAAALDAEADLLQIEDWRPVLATEPPSAARIPIFLNGHSGLGAPWWIDRFPSLYSDAATTGLQLCAVMESIVFMLAQNLERCARHGGWPRGASAR